jgi:hypothetical protein
MQICNQEIQVKEYKDQRVVTFKDIDLVHEREKGTAKRNFNSNREHFIEGVDFIPTSRKELGTKFVPNEKIIGNPNISMILITESGYLMLVKSFTDELAWQVQRELVNCYFRFKEVVEKTKKSIFPPKASSVGEIIQLGRFIRTLMKDQRATPYEIAGVVVEAIKQFGVNMPEKMLLPVRAKNLEAVRDDELDMVEFVMTFPNSSYQDYLLYRTMIKAQRKG